MIIWISFVASLSGSCAGTDPDDMRSISSKSRIVPLEDVVAPLVTPESSVGNLVRRKGPLSVDVVLRTIISGISALETAQGRGIVHGNINADTVLLGTSGEVYLTDFDHVMHVE